MRSMKPKAYGTANAGRAASFLRTTPTPTRVESGVLSVTVVTSSATAVSDAADAYSGARGSMVVSWPPTTEPSAAPRPMAMPAAPMFRPLPPERSASIVIDSENAPMVIAPPRRRTMRTAPNVASSHGSVASARSAT